MKSAFTIPSRFLPPPPMLNWLWRAKIFFGGLLWLIGMPNRGYWFWDLRTKQLCWTS
jgi:hypothetical protein